MIINDIQEMQKQGMNDSEIIQKLREQGTSPLEIHQALEQSKIKAAVAEDDNSAIIPNMQPSVMDARQEPESPEPPPAQFQAQQLQAPEPQPAQEEYPQYQQQQQQIYAPYPQQQQQYQQYQEYTPPSENVSEIAEQIADEKINAFRKKIGNIDELKILLGKKVDNIDERLKKIEDVIDLLQKAIISKIGSYGDSVEQIRDEMSMMQESFSKALPKIVKEEAKEEKPVKEKRRGDGFEHYLRR